MRFSAIAAAVVALASSSSVIASPAPGDITVDLGDISVAARVLVGPPTCPANTNGNINANVFAAVTLKETAEVKITQSLIFTRLITKANVKADVKVCLCIDASLSTNLIAAQVNAQVKADIAAAITASASLSNNLTPLGLAGIYGQVSIDVDAPVTDVDTCDCPANAIPTCTNGQCGCQQCPPGQIYNPSTGGCSPSPSTVPRRRSLSATDAKAIAARQAHREDVVKRQGSKKVVA